MNGIVMKKQEGKVKWFNETKGFGFIERRNKDDLFVHYKDIACEGRRNLLEGQSVQFTIKETEKGQQAADVLVVG
jgi:cold shock protein